MRIDGNETHVQCYLRFVRRNPRINDAQLAQVVAHTIFILRDEMVAVDGAGEEIPVTRVGLICKCNVSWSIIVVPRAVIGKKHPTH